MFGVADFAMKRNGNCVGALNIRVVLKRTTTEEYITEILEIDIVALSLNFSSENPFVKVMFEFASSLKFKEIFRNCSFLLLSKYFVFMSSFPKYEKELIALCVVHSGDIAE